MTLNSPLISASIIQNHVSELEQNIEFVFRRGNKKKTEPSCVYLNTFTNVWSSKGMVLIDYNATHVRCGASHLTSFAVLMQVTGVEMIEVHATALSFITYTGCGISIVALILTLGIFMYVRHSTGERTMIHRNLSLALLIAQSLFVGGISATFNKWFCMFVAMALHYFFLAVFSMMLVEGIHLYRQVVQVFERGSFRLKYLIILGWLLPLVIVGITAGYNSHGYGNDYMCWLDTDSGMVWAFLNLIVMVLVVRIIILSSAMSNKNNIEQAKAGVKGLILLLPLLGGTWLFGVFFVSNELIAFQYIFAILNSLQKSGGFSSRKHNTVEDKDKLYPDIPSRPSTSESIMSTRTTSGITYTIPGEVNEYDANEVEVMSVSENYNMSVYFFATLTV
ncbi:adhesion G-protein coupled receptor D1-like [Saccoglossus kowalevskii]